MMRGSASGTWSRGCLAAEDENGFDLDEVLESLDLSRAEPGSGFLEALFTRFNARVPFENATKVLRDRDVADPEAKPRRPGVFWRDHLEKGSGGTCFARVEAFGALLTALGYGVRRLLGSVERDADHAALRVQAAGGEYVADVGFPLPALLPLRPGRIETEVADLDVSETARGLRVAIAAGAPELCRSVEIFTAPVADAAFDEAWQRTYAPRSRFLREIWIRKDFPHRVMSFARGEIRVDDRHSRLRVPLHPPGGRAAALSDLFGVDAALLGEALAAAGDPASALSEARLTAYLESPSDPDAAFGAIRTRPGYGRLLSGLGEIAADEERPTGFRFAFRAPRGGAAGTDPALSEVEETVAVDASRRTLDVLRRAGESEFPSAYRVETRSGRTWLCREARLSGTREDLLRNDSLRGRLAGSLAIDLLAWARMIESPS